MNSKKLILFLILIISASSPSTVSAFPARTHNSKIEEVDTRSEDVIVTKYRIHNGVLQYRRWNETKGVWVDSRWINL